MNRKKATHILISVVNSAIPCTGEVVNIGFVQLYSDILDFRFLILEGNRVCSPSKI